MKEAAFYDKLEEKAVQCRLCSHFCRIKPGRKGICRVRENREGTLVSLVYGRVIAENVDPIEKKPIFHLKPGSLSYSIAAVGCNLKCRFCQNSQIAHSLSDSSHHDSRGLTPGRDMEPRDIVDQALAAGCASISYTYTEPTVFFELARDTARQARQEGLLNIFVTNGFMGEEAVDEAASFLDAANVDLKAFRNEFYEKYCGARLEPVQKNLIRMKKAGILVEVTTLLIPGLNDDGEELKALAGFIAEDLGTDTPWHISRFHPCYQMVDRGATPVTSLEKACNIGKKAGLDYVYMGNVPGSEYEHTCCPQCGSILVERRGYRIRNLLAPDGSCRTCGALSGIRN
ncbi:AmmeMemoRadiSam system radical SAM enzyme [Desulfospira joergensenii]|uniref:AmmeMemoRadiSam system radical SAM enzyme n=1 Tax=Desulfospira joergensenii TaxID=53329 RepID=UPI0003B4AF11|nr:AmmeMemoRadiSam system radical SAM enzyme [Desulfospira joergensenii]